MISSDLIKDIEASDFYTSLCSLLSEPLSLGLGLDNDAQDRLYLRLLAIKDLVSSGFDFLDNGFFRVVFFAKKYNVVIKVLLYTDAVNCNKAESCLISNIKDRFKNGTLTKKQHDSLLSYLCPVLDSNYIVSVYPCCKLPVHNEDEIKIAEIVDLFLHCNIRLDDVTKLSQWGYLKGKLVLLDYASWYDNVTQDYGYWGVSYED